MPSLASFGERSLDAAAMKQVQLISSRCSFARMFSFKRRQHKEELHSQVSGKWILVFIKSVRGIFAR